MKNIPARKIRAYRCYVFQTAFGLWVLRVPKSWLKYFFCHFQPFLFFLNFFSDFTPEINIKRMKMNKKNIKDILDILKHALRLIKKNLLRNKRLNIINTSKMTKWKLGWILGSKQSYSFFRTYGFLDFLNFVSLWTE